MSRPTAAATAVLVAMALGALSGCGQGDGLALARQACGHVKTSLALYARSEHTAPASMVVKERYQAYIQLREALPIAAAATSADGRWNALQTTLKESAQVDEVHLVTALKDQCAVAESGGPPPSPTTFPPIPTSSPTSTSRP